MGCKQKDLLIILRKIDLIKSIERPPKSPPKPHKGFCPMACFVFFPDPGKIFNQSGDANFWTVCLSPDIKFHGFSIGVLAQNFQKPENLENIIYGDK